MVLSVFLLGAAGLHVTEMNRDRNLAWGNTWVLLYDVGLPVSLIALLVAGVAENGRSGRRALGCTTTAPGLSPGTPPPLRGAGQSGLLHSEIVELRKRLVLAFHLAGFGFHGAGALLVTLRGNSKRCGLLSLHVLVLAQEANREDAVDRWQVEGDEAEGGRRG